MILRKLELVETLKFILECVENDDSFEGRISWEAGERHEFKVTAFFRYGNSYGQGFVRLIEEE